MKHKTTELEGALLDMAVAIAEGWKFGPARHVGEQVHHACSRPGQATLGNAVRLRDHWWGVPDFSRSWQHGGPIIERERMFLQCIEPRSADGPVEFWGADLWLNRDEDDCEGGTMPVILHGYGPTPLVAAMRAYVASKFGEEVDLP